MDMDLDIILESQMGCGTDLTLVDTAPEAVTLVQETPFYIKPVIADIDEQTRSGSKVLLFSAPGAKKCPSQVYLLSKESPVMGPVEG